LKFRKKSITLCDDSDDESDGRRRDTEANDDELQAMLKNCEKRQADTRVPEATKKHTVKKKDKKRDRLDAGRKEKHRENKKSNEKSSKVTVTPTVTNPVLAKKREEAARDGPIEISDSDDEKPANDKPENSDDDIPLDQHPKIQVEFNPKTIKELGAHFDIGCFVARGFQPKPGPQWKNCIFCGEDFKSKYDPSHQKYDTKFRAHMDVCMQTITFNI